MTDTSESAVVKLNAGPAHLDTELRMSPAGLLAVGGLVSAILAASALIVWVATTPVRRHPVARGLLRRR